MKQMRLLFALSAVALLSMLLFSSAFADEGRWSKIRIQVPERETLHKIVRLGVNLEGSRGKPGGPMECIVSESVLKRLQDEGVGVEVIIPDLSAYYESRLTSGPANAMGFGYGSMGGYYTYDEIRQQLDTLRLLHPQVIGVRDSIGATLQGRPIWAVRMTANPDAPSDRPQVLFFAMQHACEPMGMMVLLHTMWNLAEGYGVDPEVTYLLDNRDLWFVPICNPDGYEANRRWRPNGGGMRRKNMRGVVNNNDDLGVDLNRNWDSHWGVDNFGSSPFPTYEDYRGSGPFSEPETQVMRDFCNGKAFRFVMEYHSYWNTVFSPPGYDMNLETADSLLFRAYVREVTRLNHYSNGMSPSAYPANGYGSDWLYENPPPGGKTFPLLVEVGDNLDGFWPATSRILPLASENLQANLFAAWAGGACPRVQQTIVVDSSGDGDLSPGEPFEVRVTLHNFGQDPATMIGVRAGSPGSNIGFSREGKVVASLGPHADTTLSIPGEVAPWAVSGVAERVIVYVHPAPEVEFQDTMDVIVGHGELLFSDGAEAGMTNWNAQGIWGRTQVAHTGEWSFTDSPNSGYRNSQFTGLTLASPITLPHTGRVVRLEFWARWSTEPGYDYALVQASTDGGGTWSTLNGKYSSDWRQEVYTGWEPRWIQEEIDLSHLAGKEVLLAFRFSADGSTNGDGFYVDDIVVRSFAASGSRLEPPEGLDFHKVAVGEPDTLELVLRSVGTSALTVNQIDHTSDAFVLADAPTLPYSLQGTLDSLVLNVVFDPDSHGPLADTLVIASDDPVNPTIRVPLAGVGVKLGKASKYRMYAASGSPGSSLSWLDPESGEATQIGPLETAEMQTLCVRGSTDELYGTAQGSGMLQLFRLSTEHGTALPTASIGLPGSRAMAFSPASLTLPPGALVPPDQLYIATTTGKLYKANPRSGDTTFVGLAPGVKFSAMAFNPRTGELWAADVSGTKDIIVKVDPLTADTQFVGRTGDGRMTLALGFDDRGSLFALKSAAGRAVLVQVDTLTGAGTLVDTVSASGIIAMTVNPFIVSVPGQDLAAVPSSFSLEQNYPNPFNPSTTIRYGLAGRARVTLSVFNMLGQRVATLVEGEREAGYHSVNFDASSLASGVYLYRLTAGEYVQARKLILLR